MIDSLVAYPLDPVHLEKMLNALGGRPHNRQSSHHTKDQAGP